MTKTVRSSIIDLSKGKEVLRMEVTAQEMKVLKMNILGGMNTYILEKGDEDVMAIWFEKALPDQCTEEDLETIVDDEELWCATCGLFGQLAKMLGEC